MKLTELKPCARCGGKLLSQGCGNWYVIRVSTAIVNPAAAKDVLGLNMIFGGNALGLAEAFAPRAEEAVIVLGDHKEGGGWTELHVCIDCYVAFGDLCGIAESKGKDDDKQAADVQQELDVDRASRAR